MRTEIEFSVIEPPDALRQELEKFQAEYSVRIRLRELTWENAWIELVKYSAVGGAPDISCIGASWVSSLTHMSSIRPFSARDISSVGGKDAFIQAAWESGSVVGSSEIWSLPWTVFTYLIFYRQDLLEQAGIDETSAFASPQAMLETLAALKDNGIKIPWVSHAHLLHAAASWMWGAGGDFIDENFTKYTFNQPEARAGLKSFFELYRFLTPEDASLSDAATVEKFMQGDAAILIAGIDQISHILQNAPEALCQNFSVASLPGKPWIGGSSLAIWNQVRWVPDQERAALNLVTYLTSQKSQIAYCSKTSHPPARMDALSGVMDYSTRHQSLTAEKMNELSLIAQKAISAGRHHKSIPLWTRSENQITNVFQRIANQVVQDPQANIDDILSKHLDILEYRMNLTIT